MFNRRVNNIGIWASSFLFTCLAACNTGASLTATSSFPTAPISLTASVVSTTAVSLAWQDTASDESGFYVQRSTDGVNFSQLASVGAAAQASYTDTTATAGVSYTYEVVAYNGYGLSVASNLVTANTTNSTTNVSGPSAPSGLTSVWASTTSALLSWTESSSNAVTGFFVERSTDGVNFAQIQVLDATTLSTTDTSLSNANTYYYRVSAYNGSGVSAYSNISSVVASNAVTAPTCTLTAAPSSVSQNGIMVINLTTAGTVNTVYLNGSSVPLTTTTFLPGTGTVGNYTWGVWVVGPGGSNSCAVNFSITAGGGINPVGVISGLTLSAENAHVNFPQCSAGYTQVTSFADCGYGACNGNQIFCEAKSTIQNLNDPMPVLTYLALTFENSHLPGADSLPGAIFGAVADCGLGNCYGNQFFHSNFTPWNQLPSGTPVVSDVWAAPEGSRQSGTSCPAGYAYLASVADCYGGYCNGNQGICYTLTYRP